MEYEKKIQGEAIIIGSGFIARNFQKRIKDTDIVIFASGVSNPRIEKIEKLALKHGAKSLKVTGAGGGGHMFVYAEPKKHKSIEDILKKIGVEKVDFTYQDSGAKIFNITNL